MTTQIMKSRIRGIDFPAAAAKHAEEMNAWKAHTDLVAKGKAQAYPPPQASPEVASVVAFDENAGEYVVGEHEVVDDGPSETEKLRRKKNDLFAMVSQLEQEASNGIVPMGKRRLMHIRYADAVARTVDPKDPTGKPLKLGTEDQKFVDDYAAATKRADAINRHGAELHAQIEDLTAEDVDAWRPTEFPT